jgi:hypothetical protein
MPLSPFIFDPDNRFVLNEEAFMEAINPDDLPAFITSPSREYLEAAEIEPLLQTLFHRAGGKNAGEHMA